MGKKAFFVTDRFFKMTIFFLVLILFLSVLFFNSFKVMKSDVESGILRKDETLSVLESASDSVFDRFSSLKFFLVSHESSVKVFLLVVVGLVLSLLVFLFSRSLSLRSHKYLQDKVRDLRIRQYEKGLV